MRIPYGRGRAVTLGSEMNPAAVKLELSGGVVPRVRRIVSWPGFLLVLARYDVKDR